MIWNSLSSTQAQMHLTTHLLHLGWCAEILQFRVILIKIEFYQRSPLISLSTWPCMYFRENLKMRPLTIHQMGNLPSYTCKWNPMWYNPINKPSCILKTMHPAVFLSSPYPTSDFQDKNLTFYFPFSYIFSISLSSSLKLNLLSSFQFKGGKT